MGKAVGGISKVFNANPVTKALGLGTDDQQGAYATPEQKAAKDAQAYYADYDKNMGAATKGVQDGAFTKGVFGEGGMQSQLESEGKDLAARGYGLQGADHEAYGQAAGDISRQYGQQEQDVSQMLNRRGLGGASSGAAGAAFSGVQGSKNEQLAKAQTDIAQKRMADTTQRLQANRTMQQNLASQGTGLANQAWGNKGSSLQQAASAEQGLNQQNRQTMADQQAAIRPGLFSTIGQGLQAGVGNLATQAPGMAMGAPPSMGSPQSMFGGGGGNPLAKKNNEFGTDGAGGKTSMSADYLNMK